ncbi:MAG TPA: hypothetical protein VJR69_10590 [Nitrospira sp.]|nr:hypothetical protein [Nitrospira sp.]
MKWLAGAAFVAMVAAQPVWAAEPEFDPDQPFKGLGQRLLESFLGQALAALDDHLEMSGTVDPNAPQGDNKQTLRFKFYPNGKSKSDEHITAEGWFGPSTDSRQDEFHFRFAVPKSLSEALSALPENVL